MSCKHKHEEDSEDKQADDGNVELEIKHWLVRNRRPPCRYRPG